MAPRLRRETRSLATRIREQLDWHSPRLRHALRLGLCLLAGFCISESFGVAKGDWIILTSLFVCQPSYSETRRRLFQRVLGTFCGVIGGVLVVQLLPTLPGQLLLMLLAAYFFFLCRRRKYAVAVVFITIFVLAAFNLIAGEGVAVMVPRLIDTLVGSVLALLAVRLLWPDWQYRRLPGLLTDALRKNTSYFQAILDAYRQLFSGDDLEYRIARREAHRADNALVLAWQNMLVEPRKHRQLRDQAFSLTYLNHALLSYLSAFGAHRQQQAAVPEDGLDLAGEILEILRNAAEHVTDAEPDRESRRIFEIRTEIRRRVSSAGRDGSLRYLTLLYNMAEVTGQILKQARTLSMKAAK